MIGEPTSVALASVQPSQLYLDAARLEAMLDWFDFEAPNYDPVPVVTDHDFEGVPADRPVLTDGHTRAFLAHLAGHDRLNIVEDPDWPDLDQATYEACVTWCLEADVTEVGDLVGRVVDRDTFLTRWVDRCAAVGPSG